MKKEVKKAYHMIGYITFVILIGYLLLVSVYLISGHWLEVNVKKPASDLLEQGIYPSMCLKGAVLDNWTPQTTKCQLAPCHKPLIPKMMKILTYVLRVPF